MSKIEKLSIRGIRSFSPNEDCVIHFESPLTLIVGHNGILCLHGACNSKTIIECLKYITTGDLPPGSSGGAFIFDPKILNETETKARVKLLFTSATGQNMVCSRALSLQLKAGGKTTQKTLEGILAVKDAGGKQRPLSEPGSLKKKFDDIFASTKYSKALDSLKSIRKEQAGELKPLQQNVDHMKSDRDKAKKLKDNLNKVVEDITSRGERIQELDMSVGLLYEEIEEALKNQQAHMVEFQKLEQLKREELLMVKQEKDLKEDIQILSESESKLQELLHEQQKILANASHFEAEKLKERVSCEKKVEDIQRNITKVAETRGKYLSEVDSNKRRVEDRNNLLRDLCQKYDLKGSHEGNFSDTEVDLISQKLCAELTSLQTALTEKLGSLKQKENEANDQMQVILSEKKSAEEMKALRRKTKQENVRRLSEILSSINSISSDLESLESLRSSVDEKEKDLARAKEIIANLNIENTLKKLEKDKIEVENQLSELKDEMSDLSKNSDIRAKLSVKKSEKEKKEENMKRLFQTCSNDLNRHFQVEVTSQSFDAKLKELKKTKQERKIKLQTVLDKANAKVQDLETRLTIVRGEKVKKDKRVSELQTKLHSNWGNDEVEKLLEVTEKGLQEASDSLALMESSKVAYKDFENQAKNKHNCPLCERNFEHSSAFEAFVKKLHDFVSSSPAKATELKSRIDKMTNTRNMLQSDLPLETEKKRLTNELTILKQQEKDLETEFIDARSDAEDRQGELALLVADSQMIESISSKAVEYERLSKEVAQLTDEVEQINNEIGILGSSRSVEEVQDEMETLLIKEKHLRKQIERAANESKARQNDLMSREKKLNEMRMELFQLERRSEELEKLQKEKEKLTKTNQELEAELDKFDERVRSHDPELKRLEAEREAIRSEYSTLESESHSKTTSLQQNLYKLDGILTEIQRFSQRGIHMKIKEAEDKTAGYHKELDLEQQKITQLSDAIRNMHNQTSEVKIFERNIADNLRLRKLQIEVNNLRKEITSLEKHIIPDDAAKYQRQVEDLNKKISVMNGERSALEGSIQQLKNQKSQMKTDLRNDYENIENLYRRAIIDLGTEQKAISDLEKYIKAIDAAIMKYHSVKMEEINMSIKELWMRTYKGDDIDTIEIRSEPEANRGNRSYNYRVVMLKGQVVLDMRGRCSAGQKVLASIIIRLALAESFCHHCGILALDEPTTNLDEDNIISLSEALAEIINYRKIQENFQLLIITHDEKFLQYLNHDTDRYSRVYKDHHGFSQIKSIPMKNS